MGNKVGAKRPFTLHPLPSRDRPPLFSALVLWEDVTASFITLRTGHVNRSVRLLRSHGSHRGGPLVVRVKEVQEDLLVGGEVCAPSFRPPAGVPA